MKYKNHDIIRSELDELRKKRNIISGTIPNRIEDSEEEAAVEWWTSHQCFNNVENWDRLVELDTYYPNIQLIPTSIGTNIFVICSFCGEEKNATDYDNW